MCETKLLFYMHSLEVAHHSSNTGQPLQTLKKISDRHDRHMDVNTINRLSSKHFWNAAHRKHNSDTEFGT